MRHFLYSDHVTNPYWSSRFLRTATLILLSLVLFGCADPIRLWSATEINFATRECLGREAGTPFRERFCNCEVNTLAANVSFPDRESARHALQSGLLDCRSQLQDADPRILLPPATVQVEQPRGPRRRAPRRPPLEVDRNL